MKFLRRVLGFDFPDPVVGQVWRSRHSGRCIRVCSVEPYDSGDLQVSVQRRNDNWRSGWGMGDSYATNLSSWRRKLRAEGRVLIYPLQDLIEIAAQDIYSLAYIVSRIPDQQSEAAAAEVAVMRDRVRELREQRPHGDLQQAFNAAADRLDVLASLLHQQAWGRR